MGRMYAGSTRPPAVGSKFSANFDTREVITNINCALIDAQAKDLNEKRIDRLRVGVIFIRILLFSADPERYRCGLKNDTPEILKDERIRIRLSQTAAIIEETIESGHIDVRSANFVADALSHLI